MKKNVGISKFSVGSAGTEGAISLKNAGPRDYGKSSGETVVFSAKGYTPKMGRFKETKKGQLYLKPDFPKGYGARFVTRSDASKALKATRTATNVAKVITQQPAQGTVSTESNQMSKMSFGKAFANARATQGPKATFKYGSGEYSTVTKDDLRSAGNMSLREYSNKTKFKKSSQKYVAKKKKK